jgi:16S rRNA (guanine(527)-N(7))-methyltransferase RsmG
MLTLLRVLAEMEPKEGLKELLIEFEIQVNTDKASRLLKYLKLLEKWNAKINLTAKTDWIALEPLFREGIWAAEKFSDEVATHLDIGSGAGFPAIILNIFYDHVHLEMIESRGKKGAFLETVAYELGLINIRVKTFRLEEMLESIPAEKKWDCISWKAIKLAGRDILLLKEHAHARTQFWMFHGKEYAVETPNLLEEHFRGIKTINVPGTRESCLSIFTLR